MRCQRDHAVMLNIWVSWENNQILTMHLILEPWTPDPSIAVPWKLLLQWVMWPWERHRYNVVHFVFSVRKKSLVDICLFHIYHIALIGHAPVWRRTPNLDVTTRSWMDGKWLLYLSLISYNGWPRSLRPNSLISSIIPRWLWPHVLLMANIWVLLYPCESVETCQYMPLLADARVKLPHVRCLLPFESWQLLWRRLDSYWRSTRPGRGVSLWFIEPSTFPIGRNSVL